MSDLNHLPNTQID